MAESDAPCPAALLHEQSLGFGLGREVLALADVAHEDLVRAGGQVTGGADQVDLFVVLAKARKVTGGNERGRIVLGLWRGRSGKLILKLGFTY